HLCGGGCDQQHRSTYVTSGPWWWASASGQEGSITGDRFCRVVADRHDLVVAVHMNDVLFVPGAFGLVDLHVPDDDHQITGADQTRGRTVDTDDPTATFTDQCIGHEAVAVVDVDDVYLFAVDDVGGLHQICVDGDRTDVVQVGLCDGGAVDLAVHEG